MKTIKQILKFSSVALLCGVFMLSCSSDEPEGDPEPSAVIPNPVTVEGLDELSDHLSFINAEVISGKIPQAPSGASPLKISVKDTLYLMEGATIPIKISHTLATDVAGIYVQIHGPTNGANTASSTTYFDASEISETAQNDSVSTIMLSFDPGEFELPLSFPVTIIPYDKNGQTLAQTERIFSVEESFDGTSQSGRSQSLPCGFTTPPVQGWWQWEYTMQKVGDEITFLSSPEVLYGGQNIKGCCFNGESDYGASCLNGDPKNVKTLFFPTYYQIAGETFIFNANGTFERITLEKHGDPDTDNSDFCGVAPGAVTNTIEFVTYEGNWTLNPTSNYLQLASTKSSVVGGGYGNAGGVLSYSCHGLKLVRGPSEGVGPNTELFYFRQRPEDFDWYPL